MSHWGWFFLGHFDPLRTVPNGTKFFKNVSKSIVEKNYFVIIWV